MSTEDRVRWLLNRELDGELTEVERTELERSILTSGPARAERKAWQRVQAALTSGRTRDPRLNTAKLAGRIASGLERRPHQGWPSRVTIAAAAFAFALVAVAPAARLSSETPTPARLRLARAPAGPPVSPVTVQVDESVLLDDAEAVPVEIRF